MSVSKQIGDRATTALVVGGLGLILRELRQINEGIKQVTDATSRIEAALAGIQGDIDGLKQAAAELQAALDQALANQPQDVQDQINAAVAEAQAGFDAQLEQVAAKLEALDEQTGGSEASTDPNAPHPDNSLPGDQPQVNPLSGRNK